MQSGQCGDGHSTGGSSVRPIAMPLYCVLQGLKKTCVLPRRVYQSKAHWEDSWEDSTGIAGRENLPINLVLAAVTSRASSAAFDWLEQPRASLLDGHVFSARKNCIPAEGSRRPGSSSSGPEWLIFVWSRRWHTLLCKSYASVTSSGHCTFTFQRRRLFAESMASWAGPWTPCVAGRHTHCAPAQGVSVC